ncbi:MAG: hypothetical protein JW888_15065 [Pirellulales bacterium]|nr:hypothetical protein [Pirellulales bacterium]
MSALSPQPDAENPFSTRHVRPGAIPYFFPAGEDVSSVLQRLARNVWQGQIVGPHGSGKSTLLSTLLPAIEKSGKQVTVVALHDGQRRLPPDVLRETSRGKRARARRTNMGDQPPHGNRLLVVDGYEQLPWWRRYWLERRCRRRGMGLLVTSHRSVGLPEVYRTSIDSQRAERIVARLLSDWPEMIAAEEIVPCLERHGQDLREALFELYDLFEQNRRTKKPT